MRHALVRLLVGLSVGFVGAFATISLIGWLERPSESAVVEELVGVPDFGAYCERIALTAVEIGRISDRWQCVGTINGIWTVDPIDVEEVCRVQFAASTRVHTDGVSAPRWRCVITG